MGKIPVMSVDVSNSFPTVEIILHLTPTINVLFSYSPSFMVFSQTATGLQL